MEKSAQYSLVEDGAGGPRLMLSGTLTLAAIAPLERALHTMPGPIASIDLSGVEDIDTVGAWVVLQFARAHEAEITAASEAAQRLLGAVRGIEPGSEIHPPRLPAWERVPVKLGEKVYAARAGLYGVVGFFGQILIGAASLARNPARFPVKALVHQMELVGVTALPIIGLMSFLIGIVIAQQGAVQLEQFGAEALTVNLVGRITLRELGVLMTAIMVAGRSGSAFAAQLGTMKLTEEIDAMRTIGISPVEVLVIPRIMAATFMMILLGFYASVVAIVGGAVVGELALGIPFWTFLARIQEVVPTHDLWVGLIKAPVFGLIVALAGCYHGLQVRGNSEEVGRRTTMAVVSAIFAVIVLDAFFAVFFTEVGWG
ncbi:ABC transporter permease [Erythrobacter dokdonensis]|jgi:phospholipid/cholesterol/gamma-HCH transport system permease protein|uniref:ABC-type transport system permease component n=1 Tax=Erythrobacter dokdonensis DSW-74 TaxID=1300349 RepID=A0A1A7BG38_9SPHN|nr:MlaE family lipid ABC transporter permease subunit [Erythrobacter dokdonensis]MEE4317643.1 MlaE family lipid ABC transporter permease subunit [Erythrobacter sp.]OBV10372.1 ABC-type transport system permease component [Erythrobacter dokdonensis DSW-74]